MENTLENKAKFFAQYWGQKIWLQDSVDWIFNIEPSMMKDGIIEISSLLLTPISDITDEDAEELGYSSKYLTEDDADFGMSSSLIFLNEIKDYPYNDPDLISSDTDFLRSKGYAIRWNGITVEEQIEYGWVKLKTSNQ